MNIHFQLNLEYTWGQNVLIYKSASNKIITINQNYSLGQYKVSLLSMGWLGKFLGKKNRSSALNAFSYLSSHVNVLMFHSVTTVFAL